jgi:RNA polymerase sigma-70 factor, ECF subfamily
MRSEDEDLLAGLRQRDSQVFTRFFETYADRVYRLAFHMLGNDADADEIVQLTFLSAIEAIDRFEPRARLGTWLYRIAYNHIMMHLRRRHPLEPLPDQEDAVTTPTVLIDWSMEPEDHFLSHEAQEMIASAINTLPEKMRAAFVLRDIEQFSTAECAHIQGITEAACKVRLHRARLLLREKLSIYYREHIASEEREGI